jgi:hypothetical protein
MPNFHTAWINDTTNFDADIMNPALASLDKAITYKHNFIFHCDGDIEWDSGTGTLTWSDVMRIIFISAAGNAIANEIAAGNIELADNEYAYVDLNETDDSVLTVAEASITTGSAAGYVGVGRIVLGYRNTASDEFYPVAIKQALGASGGGGGHTILEEGTPVTQRTGLNFIGDGVDVTDDSGNDETEITIPGGTGIELKGYSETEVTVDASGGTGDLVYSDGNVFKVTVGDGVDTILTFSSLPTGKACSATIRLELAGAVPSSISIQSITIDTTGVTSSGELIVEMQRIGTTWYAGEHHAS